MSKSFPGRLRRQLCLAIPAAMVAGVASASAFPRISDIRRLAQPHVQSSWNYEVALTVDVFGETSKPVVQSRYAEHITVSGVHGGKPWTLEYTIANKLYNEQLNVVTKLSSGDDVLAAKSLNASAGQRVVLRADDQVYAALVIKSV